jgi:hypothetical protein
MQTIPPVYPASTNFINPTLWIEEQDKERLFFYYELKPTGSAGYFRMQPM